MFFVCLVCHDEVTTSIANTMSVGLLTEMLIENSLVRLWLQGRLIFCLCVFLSLSGSLFFYLSFPVPSVSLCLSLSLSLFMFLCASQNEPFTALEPLKTFETFKTFKNHAKTRPHHRLLNILKLLEL